MTDNINLKAYIESQNKWRNLFPSSKVNSLEMPTTKKEALSMLDNIECDLSPENLCCDGEIGGEELRKKSGMLNGAYNECVNLLRVLK